MKLAFIEYYFLLDTTNTYQHVSQFENDLTKFFSERGLEAQILNNVAGQIGKRILYIKKKAMMDAPRESTEPVKVGRPKTPQGLLKDMKTKQVKAKERDYKKGKFLPSKKTLRR